MRKTILLLTAAIILVLVNYSIWQRETLISNGRTILLELAPVDPRSLMQGEYMALRFKMATEIFSNDKIKGLKDGRIILAVDANNVATFRRFDDSSQPAADEALIRYRIRNQQAKFVTNAFFFQEKQGQYYQNAKYGEFRLSHDGEAILVGMRGPDLQILGPKAGEIR
jgi:uncharacterized membrane-anchored protein